MKRKTDLEHTIAAVIKTVRTAVRLKYSLMADREINEKAYEAEQAVLNAHARGEDFWLDVADLFDLDPKALGQ